MKRPLYGLVAEWSKPQSGYVALTSAEALSIGDMSALDGNMLRHNRIPHLLPAEFAEIDGGLTIHYHAAGKRLLSKAMRRDQVTPLECFRILYAIASVIDESKRFMLNEERYVLQEEFIFLGKELTDVHLMYVPLESIPGKGALQEEFRRLTRRLFERVRDFDGYRVNELLDCLKEETFGIAAMKRLLLEIVVQLEAESGQDRLLSEHGEDEQFARQGKGVSDEEAHITPLGVEIGSDMRGARSGQGGAVSLKIKIYFVCAAIGIPIIWLWYNEQSSDAALNIGIGATLLFVAGYLFFLHADVMRISSVSSEALAGVRDDVGNMRSSAFMDDQPQTQTNGTNGSIEPVWNERDSRNAQPLFGKGTHTYVGSIGGDEAQRKKAHLDEYYKHLSSHTSLLVSKSEAESELDESDASFSGETVFLGQSGMETTMLAPSAVLEVHSGDEQVFLPIAANRLVIGRKIDASGTVLADYEVDASGISRQHLAFEHNGSEYVIKDLESKNGSYLNGERLHPHREYVLHDGDRIRIATVECVFKNFT